MNDEKKETISGQVQTKNYSWRWKPRYVETIQTPLSESMAIALALKTIEKLEWELLYFDEAHAEAWIWKSSKDWSEKVEIAYSCGEITIRSKSNSQILCDFGVNHKRILMFIYQFEKLQEELGDEGLKELEEKHLAHLNWDDYEVPETLPLPGKSKTPNIQIFIAGALLVTTGVGLLMAFLTVKVNYHFFVYELAVALLLAQVFFHLVRLSNYTDPTIINRTLYGVLILLYFFLNPFFQYLILVNESAIPSVSYFEFINLKLKNGLGIEFIRLGVIEWVIVWTLQVIAIRFMVNFLFSLKWIGFLVDRVPVEVVDYATYHFMKGKTEGEVREELAKKGWTEKQSQQEVFEAIAGRQGVQNFRRNN